MSFDVKVTLRNTDEPEKLFIISNETADKHNLQLAIVGPNKQQATFKVAAVDILVALKSFYPEIKFE